MGKTVLCYGDSLTWGYDAAGQDRHAYEDRWPGVLQQVLGPSVHVVAEGLNGRTTAYDDHLSPADRNGARLLPSILHSHAPLDLVVILLGTNDLKRGVGGSATAAARGMERLVQIVQHHPWPFGTEDGPDILLVAPPLVCETANPVFAAMYRGAVEESQNLAPLYRDLADDLGCGFFDAASVAVTTPVDGVHLDAANTRALGRGLEPIIRMMLGL